MTSRRLLILGAVAIVAIVAGVWLAGREGSSGASAGNDALYPGLKEQLNAIDAVRIYKAGDARVVDLARKNDVWTVSERNGYPADDGKVRKLLIAIADAKVREEKTSDPQQYAKLGVEDTKGSGATSLRIELAGAPKPVDLIVGKNGGGANSNYVRRAGEPKSWLIGTSIDTSATPEAWLRKDIIDVSADRIQSAAVNAHADDKGAKPYTAAKSTRADANFSVEGLPKGKSLSAPTAANSFAMALTGLSLADVKPASAFQSTQPAAHATFKTFDGLVVELDGWVQDQKHYIALRPSFDAAQAERFKVATAPSEEKKDEKSEGAAQQPEPPKPAAPDVAEDAKSVATKVGGWVYEIPDYKYEGIFKPVEQLVGSK
ncbi:MAG TPA: DUF4340 domain-containing protein [Steroidobacteraceae bacterium]|nr:DUF4340 domain-containing protein [Steroidobacteraceae bacterium]